MLIDLILDQYERSTRWQGDFSGNASFRVEEKHYQSLGKKTLIEEALSLEAARLLKIRWVKGYYKEDIEKVEYPLTHMEDFYHKAGRTPKYIIMQQKHDMVAGYYDRIGASWIRSYTEEEIFPRLANGTDRHDCEELRKLYECFAALDQLETPVFKKVFSKRTFKNSKYFERELQDKVIRIAKKYLAEIDDGMEDTEILSQLYIEEYAQELAVKGCLLLEVSGRRIDTGVFPYGTVLNTQTIKNALILDNPQIMKVLTIENKANYVAENYEKGTLILYSHGYFTPLERIFLKQLRERLSGQKVIYQHSGDLDYGGIKIFQYIKNQIFPESEPYRMDRQTFEEYQRYGEPIEQGPLEKLKNLKDPMLQELIDHIVETGIVIEQEAYL